MDINESSEVNNSSRGISLVGGAGVLALLALSAAAVVTDAWKVLIIGWVAFAAMAVGALLGERADATDPQRLVWGYGLASGAMVTSAAMFLVPQAINIGRSAGAPQIGGIGIALGIVVGYSGHVVGHRLTHRDLPMDVTTAQITAHALSAGLIIGLVYGSMPTLGLLLGLAIVSHKGPAGYAAARRLRRNGKPVSALLLPAAGVGITAIPTAALPIPGIDALNAVVFGFAAGIFLHVAMDFLPVCEAGSEIDQVCSLHEESHELLDRLRVHAVGSTVVGAAAVVVAWFFVTP
ncbi:ZIP family metal transporter [Halosimplex aquaticum]|uniref:ZIP family metal transporter n=1 Tax=Halosimplex aquaticum TaxID=3026162 RepID=A0ABD5Y3P6_9EURY|nr:ZIP family metal transporter [Halosimplex aquaticum]